MATETLMLREWGDESKPDRTVVVEYIETPHWCSGPGMDHYGRQHKAYDVKVDGEPVGKVETTVENTDRHYGRIRSPGKGRIAWAWRNATEHSSPGVPAPTRRDAVARLLGYSVGQRA